VTAPAYTYHGYKLYNVYQKTTPDLRREIIAFWQSNNAIPDPRETERRVYEVVYIIRNMADGNCWRVFRLHGPRWQSTRPLLLLSDVHPTARP
jgi:hypothetical protein